MPHATRQYIAAICIIVVAAFGGLWLGEHRAAPLPVRDLLALLSASFVAALVLWSAHRVTAVAAAAGVALVFGASWFYGVREATQAFNECVQNGERVRQALSSYRSAHGRFPSVLAELGGRLPGELLLPPHTLNYKTNSIGYSLSFSDWLVTHEATEFHKFVAHK